MEVVTHLGIKAVALDPIDKVSTLQDVLDVIAAAWHENCSCVIFPKESLPEAFFDLKTGFAGEVLQKYTNYQIKLAITGDFSGFTSKSLKDFIYESNKGSQIFFTADISTAMEAMKKTLD